MNGIGPTLFATPDDAREIAAARAVVCLVGGYDGSGNYGDIALVEAALELVERAGPDLLAIPVLERPALGDYRGLVADGGRGLPCPVFFDPTGAIEDDLVPVAAPRDLAFGACYLYGGGYLNGSWGGRKLALLGASEALVEAGGAEPFRLASGLQVEPGWLAGPVEGDARALRSFAFLGGRDEESVQALAGLGSAAAVSSTGDDAIGLLGQLAAAPPPTGDGPLRVNVHFAEHAWTSEDPEATLAFYVGFLAELRRLSARPLLVQPLLAYLDRRIDERSAQGRLRTACAGAGIELAEPLLLRPSALAELSPRLREAHLTVSCSYHVAMTSLMLGVPSLLLGDNSYYAQKAAGLAADFALPPAFTPAASPDPLACAAEIAATLLDPEGAANLHGSLLTRREALRRRRANAELELLSQLGAAALSGLAARVAELAERLRERSAEPTELHAEVAALRTELEELQRRLEETPLEVELRIQEAETRTVEAHETLAAVLESRTWKLAAPLRRAGALLRRR